MSCACSMRGRRAGPRAAWDRRRRRRGRSARSASPMAWIIVAMPASAAGRRARVIALARFEQPAARPGRAGSRRLARTAPASRRCANRRCRRRTASASRSGIGRRRGAASSGPRRARPGRRCAARPRWPPPSARRGCPRGRAGAGAGRGQASVAEKQPASGASVVMAPGSWTPVTPSAASAQAIADRLVDRRRRSAGERRRDEPSRVEQDARAAAASRPTTPPAGSGVSLDARCGQRRRLSHGAWWSCAQRAIGRPGARPRERRRWAPAPAVGQPAVTEQPAIAIARGQALPHGRPRRGRPPVERRGPRGRSPRRSPPPRAGGCGRR